MANEANLQKLKRVLQGPPEAAPRHVLKSLREHHGLTQAQLGEAAGVSSQLIGLIESGDRSMTPQVAMKAASRLGVGRSDLELAHGLDVLRRGAESGQVGPETVVQVAEKSAQVNGESEQGEDVMKALSEIHDVALKASGGGGMGDRDSFGRKIKGSGTGPGTGGEVRAATKSNLAQSSGYGLRDQQDAPYGPIDEDKFSFRDSFGRSREDEPIQRDENGKRINKKHGPQARR